MVKANRLLQFPRMDNLQVRLARLGVKPPEAYTHQALQAIAEHLMESEVRALLDAARYERSSARRAYRNGYRESVWSLAVGDIPLHIPKLRRGTYYPSFLHDKAAIVIEKLAHDAYWLGIRFEQVSALAHALDVDANPAEIACLHEALYDLVQRYQRRAIDVRTLYLDLVALDEQQRRYIALAFEDGELYAHDITREADERFWQDFIRRLDARSVRDVEYIAVSHLRHVVRLTQSDAPQMARAA